MIHWISSIFPIYNPLSFDVDHTFKWNYSLMYHVVYRCCTVAKELKKKVPIVLKSWLTAMYIPGVTTVHIEQ